MSHQLFSRCQVGSRHHQSASKGVVQVVKSQVDEPRSLDCPGKRFHICRCQTAGVQLQATAILRLFNVAVNVSVMGTLRGSASSDMRLRQHGDHDPGRPALVELQGDGNLKPQARSLVNFTDNHLDASLQAGHFNVSAQVALHRSVLYRATPEK
jgi:hypothetical protein